MNRVCAIIVTYNPEANLLTNIAAIVPQVDQVLIVDNASSQLGKSIIEQLPKSEKIKFIHNQYNLGIATALNLGVRFALAHQFEWVITFDQDSLAPENLLSSLFEEYQNASNPSEIAVLAPVPFDQATGFSPKPYRDIKDGHDIVDTVITSGALLRLSAIEKVGYFDDSFFIDYVDHDFCLRLHKFGYRLLLVPKSRLAHNYGNPKRHKMLGFTFFSYNYPPSRRYYLARNRVVAYKRHRKILRWLIYDTFAAIKDVFKIILVENEKSQKFKAIFKGTIDGLLGRMGNKDGFTYSMPKPEKYFVEWRKEIVPLINPHMNGPVNSLLDLGCGAGETSSELKKRGLVTHVTGIEAFHGAAAIARTKLDQIIEADIDKLDWDKQKIGPFDVILALDILEHLVDPWTTLNKVTHLLKPGGAIVASIPNIQHYSVVFPLLFMGEWRYSEEGLLDSTHLRFFTYKSAIQLMVSSGLKVEIIEYNGMKPGSLTHLMNKLTFGIFKNFFIFQVLIRVTKPVET